MELPSSAAENLGYVYAQNFGLPITSLRYFTVYGPRQRPDMAFTRFIKANLEGKEITIYGDGNQSRDFTFILDIIDANIATANSISHGDTLNIGGGSVHSIKDVLKIISDTTGIENKLSFNPSPKGDVMRTEVTQKRLKKQ